MLFDLSSTRRRRTTVKIVYSLLAILMVVGLVLLGVGTGSGGLLDSNNNTGGNGSSSSNGLANGQIKSAEKQIKKDPNSATGYTNLIEAYWSAAQSASNYDETSNTYTAEGHKDLNSVVTAWKQYAPIAAKGTPDINAVTLAAYAMGITGDYADAAVLWQEWIKQNPTALKGYECLEATAYANKNTTLGADALTKAVSVAPKLSRTTTKTELDQIKTATAAKEFVSEGCAG